MIGRTLSHYRVLEKLGSGGMGEVYVAEDTKLSRKVALKVLPPEMASPERLMRFEREAKAVAALDHPNIVTIYSVEEAEGVNFITMQLVRGKTLTDLISKKALSLNKLFEIAIPLADAVSAAHEQGIIHRDLKPDNLMVSDEGRLMILDFGLAKLKQEFAEEGLSELPTQSPTQEGRILGTVAYMSPEQAEGKKIDHRSDIFSIGIILYEMATGQRPFQGDTTASMLSSILRDTPTSATELNPALPQLLSRVIRRCLTKDASRRYQTALDVRNELEELKADVDSGEVFEGAPSRQHSKGKPWLFAAAVVVLALALAGTLTYLLRQADEGILRLTNPVQVTSAVGVEDYPTWAPDGLRLAYQSNQSGNDDIWVTQVSGGEPVNLTEDYIGPDQSPSWSPDGSQIVFYSYREGGGYFTIPAIGGVPRQITPSWGLSEGFGQAQWSLDGRRLAYPAYETKSAYVEILMVKSGESSRVVLPGEKQYRLSLSWSPDERFFAYADAANESSDATQIRILRLDDGVSFSVMDGLSQAWPVGWGNEGRSLYFISNHEGAKDLWSLPVSREGKPEGNPKRLTTGVGIRKAAFSADGTKLVYSRGQRVANVFRVPLLPGRPATWKDAEQLTFDTANVEFIDISPDGTQLLLQSDRRGNPDIWLLPIGGVMQQITTDPSPDWAPRWSPDERSIAFYAYRSGNREIWVRPLGKGVARQLTQGERESVFPAWSPDGQEIVFSTFDIPYEIWAVSVDGGEPRQVTTNGFDVVPVYSPDGKWIVFASHRGTMSSQSLIGETRGAQVTQDLWRVPVDGGEPEQITRSGAWKPEFSPDGKHLFFFGPDSNVWSLDLATVEERVVTKLAGRNGNLQTNCIATDGQYLYFAWGESTGDIWVMDVVLE